ENITPPPSAKNPSSPTPAGGGAPPRLGGAGEGNKPANPAAGGAGGSPRPRRWPRDDLRCVARVGSACHSGGPVQRSRRRYYHRHAVRGRFLALALRETVYHCRTR